MAKDEHLRILKEGVAVWNKWRNRNPQTIPDLSQANLSKLFLSHADFSETNLAYTDFSDTDLRGSDFGGAHLTGAKLQRAIISPANSESTYLESLLITLT